MSNVSTLKVVKNTLLVGGAVVHTLNGGLQGPPGPFVPTGQTKQVLFVNAAGTGADADTGLTYDKTTGVLTVGGKTVTANAPALQATQTWNNAGITFTGALLNVTDQASGALSKLLDLQVGGSSQMYARKDGTLVAKTAFQIDVGQNYISSSFVGLGVNNSLRWGASTDGSTTHDLILLRGAAGVLEQRNGANAQTLRVYGNFIDAANYQRLELIGNSGSYSRINAAKAGTGTNLGLILDAASHILAISGTSKWQVDATTLSPYPNTGNDNAFDVGTPSWRVRTGYFGTSLVTPVIASPSNSDVTFTGGASGTGGWVRNALLQSNFPILGFNSNFGGTSGYGGIGYDRTVSTFVLWTAGTTADVAAATRTVEFLSGSFRLFNSYIDASNYDRLALRMNGVYAEIATQSAGSGVARHLALRTPASTSIYIGPGGGADQWIFQSGALIANGDGVVNIGQSNANRPDSIYARIRVGVGGGANSGAVNMAPGLNAIGLFIDDGGGAANSYLAQYRYANDWYFGTSHNGVGVNKNIAFGVGDALSGAKLTIPGDGSQPFFSSNLDLRNGLSPTTFLVYNTYTDAANYERLGIFWSSNRALVITQAAGTGTARALCIGSGVGADLQLASNNTVYWIIDAAAGRIVANGDNLYDVGQTNSGRPRTINVGTSVVTPAVQFPATQVASADPNTLDDYEEGTFTPTIAFGGAAVGVTYGVQSGTYTKVGNKVSFKLTLTLTAKGSSVGGVAVQGLPFSANATVNTFTAVAVRGSSLASLAGALVGLINPNTSAISLEAYGATGSAAIADTNVTNTTSLVISGTYFV